MKRLLRYAKREWERTACAVTALLCALLILSWLFGGEPRGNALQSRPLPEHERAFGDMAFAFLHETPRQTSLARNPFLFEVRAPSGADATAEPDADADADADAETAAEAEPRHPEPAPDRGSDEPVRPQPDAPPSTPARPESRLVPCDLTFVFYNMNTSGKPVALLELRNPAAASAAPLAKPVEVGETLFGMRVVKIETDTLYLVDAAGRRHRVDLGDRQRVAIRVKP